ncbi:hypothetical protein [Terribacillus sp. DMT04]|nr:hypothetical protein [Terribacillus sp. DMT04]
MKKRKEFQVSKQMTGLFFTIRTYTSHSKSMFVISYEWVLSVYG